MKVNELRDICEFLSKVWAVIFDFDGVIAQTLDVYNMTDKWVIETFGTVPSKSLYELQREREYTMQHAKGAGYEAHCANLIETYQIKGLTPNQLLKIRYNHYEKILSNIDYSPGVVAVFNKLEELGIDTALATMSDKTQLDIYTKQNKTMLRQMNLKEKCKVIGEKGCVLENKPSPAIYNWVLNELDMSPDMCVAIEDSLEGVQAAKNAGLRVIAIRENHAENDRKKIDQIADVTIDSFFDILHALRIISRE